MRHRRRAVALLAVGGFAAIVATSAAHATSTAFCISCTGPDRTYICRVETPGEAPAIGALQLYCILRTAKEEGHKACTVNRQVGAACSGIEKAYTYNGPALPQTTAPLAAADDPTLIVPAPAAPSPPEQPAPQKTMVQVTSNAAHATGHAVKQIANGTGNVARNTGNRVGRAAKTIAGAARSAFQCMRSLFSHCGADQP